MPKYQITSWSNYDIGDPGKASNEVLIKAVERAGRVANQRLRALKKAGFTGGMYAHAMADIGLPRKRFKEHAGNMSRGELLREYVAIRNFMSAKTSTPGGVRKANAKRYRTAVERGFSGSEEEFYELVDQYFQAETLRAFDSNVIYDIITAQDEKKRETVDEVLAMFLPSKGEALLEYQERLEKKR